MNTYDYPDLFYAASQFNAAQEDINALGEWFESYGQRFWNGEYFDADGLPLYRLYKKIDDDDFEVIGYTWSQSESLESLKG